MKRKWYYGNEDDEKALAIIKARYGFTDDSVALRFALRLVASPDAVQIKIASGKAVKRVKKSLEE
jgi:hypothetical protein